MGAFAAVAGEVAGALPGALAAWCAAGALPAETTKGTRLRIAEVLDGQKPIATWR